MVTFTPLETVPCYSPTAGLHSKSSRCGVNVSLESLTASTAYERLMMCNDLLNLDRKVKGINPGNLDKG